MTPDEELRRANQAQQVLDTPIVKETLEFMEREITEMWLACPARDTEGREWLWRQMTVARKFKDLLRGTMESGKIAAAQLREKESLAQRALKAVRR